MDQGRPYSKVQSKDINLSMLFEKMSLRDIQWIAQYFYAASFY
jgi:hypothetical protein